MSAENDAGGGSTPRGEGPPNLTTQIFATSGVGGTIAAVRGRHEKLGGWKQAYREAETLLPPWEEVIHRAWEADRVLPWEHLKGPLPKATLRKHHDEALA